MLNNAYRALVLEQSFEKGRYAVAAPPEKVHARIVNGSTDLGLSGLVFNDGRMWLDWSAPYGDPAVVDTVATRFCSRTSSRNRWSPTSGSTTVRLSTA